MNDITLTSSLLPVKKYSGQRVVTFKDIDTVHQRPTGTARRNFNKNRSRFIEGEDFFKICADEIRTHKITEISSKTHEDITLITESGYLMLVKSFNDDLSWNVQRQLVNSYFHNKEKVMVENCLKLLADLQILSTIPPKIDELEKRVFALETDGPRFWVPLADETIIRFLDECCMKRTNCYDGITTARTYDAYRSWCWHNGIAEMNRRNFSKQISQHYERAGKFNIRKTVNGSQFYAPFTLKPEYR